MQETHDVTLDKVNCSINPAILLAQFHWQPYMPITVPPPHLTDGHQMFLYVLFIWFFQRNANAGPLYQHLFGPKEKCTFNT